MSDDLTRGASELFSADPEFAELQKKIKANQDRLRQEKEEEERWELEKKRREEERKKRREVIAEPSALKR